VRVLLLSSGDKFVAFVLIQLERLMTHLNSSARDSDVTDEVSNRSLHNRRRCCDFCVCVPLFALLVGGGRSVVRQSVFYELGQCDSDSQSWCKCSNNIVWYEFLWIRRTCDYIYLNVTIACCLVAGLGLRLGLDLVFG